MPFVVDASVAAAWLLPDEGHPRSEAAFALLAEDHAIVPSLWWFEMRNLLVTNERRGRISSEQTSHALALLAALPIQFDREVDDTSLLGLARLHRLSVYDAAYLELARRWHVPLATLDIELAKAAVAERVPLVGGM